MASKNYRKEPEVFNYDSLRWERPISKRAFFGIDSIKKENLLDVVTTVIEGMYCDCNYDLKGREE